MEDLSREFGYTKQYLMRLFRRESGKSPIAYLNEIKLLRSTAELANEEKSIAEVAESCGFADYKVYRTKNIPIAGSFVKDADKPGEQLTLF